MLKQIEGSRAVAEAVALARPEVICAYVARQIVKLGGQPVRFAINPQYNLQNDRGLSEWSVAFTFTALFPTF